MTRSRRIFGNNSPHYGVVGEVDYREKKVAFLAGRLVMQSNESNESNKNIVCTSAVWSYRQIPIWYMYFSSTDWGNDRQKYVLDGFVKVLTPLQSECLVRIRTKDSYPFWPVLSRLLFKIQQQKESSAAWLLACCTCVSNLKKLS